MHSLACFCSYFGMFFVRLVGMGVFETAKWPSDTVNKNRSCGVAGGFDSRLGGGI